MTKGRLIEILWDVLDYRGKYEDTGLDLYKSTFVCENVAFLSPSIIGKDEAAYVLAFLRKYFSRNNRNTGWLCLHYRGPFISASVLRHDNWEHRNNILLDAIAFIESTGTYK